MLKGLISARTLVTQAKQVGTLENTILQKLKEKYGYNLFHAEVKNTSWQHDKQGAESHLELVLVTHDFEGVKKSERENTINEILKKEIETIEEFKLTLLTPSKWFDSNQRGLKLPEKYNQPPINNLKQMVNEFQTVKRAHQKA